MSGPLWLAAGIPSPSQGTWYLGPLPLRAYALAIFLGVLVAGWLTNRRYRARGGPAGAVFDATLVAVFAGIVGARIYHVLTSPDRYFGADGELLAVFRVWEGGLGIWGAIAGGAVGAWLSLRRSGLRLAPFADSVAPALLLAQGIGRLGNYFNQELFGAPTTLPWGLQIDASVLRSQGFDYPAGTLFHPTFLYELLWCFAMAGVLLLLDRRLSLTHGRLFWLYVALYSLGRGWIETLRIDEAQLIFGLRLNVWTSVLLFIAGVAAFAILTRRRRGEPEEIWLPGWEPDDDEDGDGDEPAPGSPTQDAVTQDAVTKGREEIDTAEPDPPSRRTHVGSPSADPSTIGDGSGDPAVPTPTHTTSIDSAPIDAAGSTGTGADSAGSTDSTGTPQPER